MALTQIDNSHALGEVIQRARKAQSLTQDDLAGLSGVGRRFISELENGKDTAQLGKVLHILSTLGIALSASTQWSLNDD